MDRGGKRRVGFSSRIFMRCTSPDPLRAFFPCSVKSLGWKDGRFESKPPLFDASKHKSPPYITAKPDITVQSLTGEKSKGQLKFIILATDGRECTPAV